MAATGLCMWRVAQLPASQAKTHLTRTAWRTPSYLTSSAASSLAPRYATVGVAKDYRLVSEREWRISQDTDPQRVLVDVLGFLLDALTIALTEDMPPCWPRAHDI